MRTTASSFALLFFLSGCSYSSYGIDEAASVAAPAAPAASPPAAPTSLTLSSPSDSVGEDSTPTLTISGVSSGDAVGLYTDSACSTQVASGTASGSSINLSSSILPLGSYTFYANRVNSDGSSACSSASVLYTFVNPTRIYRSIGPVGPEIVSNSTSGPLMISGNTAFFSSSMPLNLGVGDVIVYDCNGNSSLGTGDCVAVIVSRNAIDLTVTSASGGMPMPYSLGSNWKIFPAYTSLFDALIGNENAAITAAIGSTDANFDSFSLGKNIVAANQQWNFLLKNGVTEAAPLVVSANWITDAARYLKIYAPKSSEFGASMRHGGVYNPTLYNLTQSLTVMADYVRIEGLQIHPGGSSNANSIIVGNPGGTSASDVRVTGNLIFLAGASSNATGVNHTTSGKLLVNNNIIYNYTGGGSSAFSTATNGLDFVYNNTVVGATTGFKIAGSNHNNVSMINNIAQGCTDGYSTYTGGVSDYNISDLSVDAPGAHSRNMALVMFKASGSNDYRLSTSDLEAQGTGLDLATDANYPFSTDILGVTRGLNWDIGASTAVP